MPHDPVTLSSIARKKQQSSWLLPLLVEKREPVCESTAMAGLRPQPTEFIHLRPSRLLEEEVAWG